MKMPDLRETVKKAVTDINYQRYKETMHSLIAKDIENVRYLIRDFGDRVNIRKLKKWF